MRTTLDCSIRRSQRITAPNRFDGVACDARAAGIGRIHEPVFFGSGFFVTFVTFVTFVVEKRAHRRCRWL
jgi:hypothetical protein